MKSWLYLCVLCCFLFTLFTTPAKLLATSLRQEEMAILQLANQSSQSLAICDIFGIRNATDVVLDRQEQINLAPGEQKQFSVPPGRYRLLITACDQTVLMQEHDLIITDVYLLPLAAPASPASSSTQPRLPATGEVMLQIYNKAEQTICYVLITSVTAATWDEGQGFEADIATGETYALTLVPGNYDLAMVDCEGNFLLFEQDLLVKQDHTLSLTKTDVNHTFCEVQKLEGFTAYEQSHYQEALTALQAALTCFHQMGNQDDEGTILTKIGAVHYAQWQYDEALASYEQALAIVREVGDRDGEGVNLFGIGSVYHNQGRYSEALVHYEQALAIVQEVGDRSREGAILIGIGAVYYAQWQYDEALVHYKQALAIVREVGDRDGEGVNLFGIGSVYHNQRRYSEALVHYEQALAIRREVGDRAGEGTILNTIGLVYHNQGQYRQALVHYEQALAIAQEVGDRAGEGKTLNNIGGVYRAQGRYDKALARHEQALAIAQEVGDRASEGTSINNIGVVYDTERRYDEALVHYEQALAIRREVGNQAGEGTTLNNIGVMYHAQGQYDEALASYEQALAIVRKVGDQDGEGTTLNNIGAVHHAQGRYDEALASYEQALAIVRKVGDQDGEGTTLNNIGAVHHAQDRYDDALARYEQALAIRREVGDRDGEGATLNNIGAVHHAQGRYDDALVHYEQALAILRRVGDRDGEGATLNNIGEVYRTQGRSNEALASYEQALAIAQGIGDRVGEGTTLNNIGAVYYTQGRYSEALASYEQARVIAQDIGDRAGEGTTLINIGMLYNVAGRYIEALVIYEWALAIAREAGNRTGEGTILNNIGGMYDAQGRYGEALETFEQALAIVQEVGDRSGEGAILINIGWVYRANGQYSEALRSYREGIEVLESVRSAAGSDQARTSFVEGYAAAYDRVITLLHQQDAVAQAFWYSERGRVRVLLDAIATGQVQLSDNEAAVLLDAEQEAYAVRQSAQDALAKARAATPPDPIWVDETEATLRAAEADYEQASDAITAHSAQLATLIPGRQQVPQLAEVQAMLPADTTLLSYWTLEDKTLAFVITAKDATIVELPDVTAQTVLTLTQNLHQWSNLDNSHPLPLRQLYAALIAPLADKLKTPHLAIIPHQSLHYVPFAALVDEAHNKQYLGEQYTLSLLPSASMLPFLQQNATAAQANRAGGAVVFGNPASNEPGLPRLHYAATEASAVADLLNTAVLTDTAARETTLKQAARGARIVHLAAHGTYNQANALYSAIYLAPSSPLTPTQSITATDGLPTVDTSLDGRLETHEIFDLPLEGNDLVVLSACQTSLGNLSRGDELVGLTRAFFFAKSPTVISSLWNVDDAATETLMVAFYKHWLEDGMSKAGALQAAQADVRGDPRWVSPFYWAGFVLNGHPGDTSQ